MNSRDNISRHTIAANASILEALRGLNSLSGDAMTLIVVDADGRMTGTLTDGDIRRSLLAGHTLADAVGSIAHKEFAALRPGDDFPRAVRSIRSRGIRLLPVLRADGTIEHLIDLKRTANNLPLSALVMAGGRGERLRPLTDTTPKPLLRVGDKPIIDYNIEALAHAGIDDVTVSVRYLAEQIEVHFSRPVAGIDVRCVRETEPLGTIGALSIVDDMRHDDVLVMNSDLLTDISFEEMYVTHRDDGNDITIAAIPYTLSVPYAILATDGNNRVTSLEEKPTYSYYANAGIYIVGPRAMALLSRGEHLDAPQLIDRAIAAGLAVGYFPINGTWIDIGTPSDYRHACELMKYHRKI